jgi:L-threonylcarbamoyladenylate synthase
MYRLIVYPMPMEIIKDKNRDAAERAAEILKSGGVVMHTTETCYGLSADIFNEEALRKVYLLKKMDGKKPVSIMVRSFEEAKMYAEFSEGAVRLAKRFWPGPLTIILPKKDSLPVFFNRGEESVGIRCPDSAISRNIMEVFNGPLTTTSANITGKPECYTVEAYLKQLKGEDFVPDLIIDSGKSAGNLPSTIVKQEGEKFIYVREGAIFQEVYNFLGF